MRREEGREGEMDKGSKGGREGWREGGREGGKREGGMEGGRREGEMEKGGTEHETSDVRWNGGDPLTSTWRGLEPAGYGHGFH